MTPKLSGVDLRKVRVKCSKLRCRTGDFVLHRHHKGHQFAFVKAFQSRHQQPRYRRFVERYFQYHEDDVVLVCSKHHREIHFIYDEIIQSFKHSHELEALAECSWKQAEELMSDLVSRCNQWLRRETPGSDRPWPSNGNTKRKAEDAKHYLERLSSLNSDLPF